MSETAATPFAALTPQSDDRRREQREEPASTSDDRVTWLERHWQKLAWTLGLLVTTCGVATRTLGLRIAGPSDLFAAQAHADTLLLDRVTRLEKRADRVDVALSFQSYMLCVSSHESDPVVVEKCRHIVDSYLARGTP